MEENAKVAEVTKNDAHVGKRYCKKCHKWLKEIEFYMKKDKTRLDFCKKCLTMHVDMFNPDTFVWILEKMDMPYIIHEWNVLRDREYAADPYNAQGAAVLGKYLAKMRLGQYKDNYWADSEALNKQNLTGVPDSQIEEQEKADQELKEQFERGEISEAEYKTLISATTMKDNEHNLSLNIPYAGSAAPQNFIGNNNPFDEQKFLSKDDLPDIGAELTKEEKIELALKWGREYTPEQWIKLETDYQDMLKSFDIQDADSLKTLKFLCKTNLKAEEAIDCGDIDGFQKLTKAADTLRKSAKFTAAQNKDKSSDSFDSIGVFIEMCEREGGFIPRFASEQPQDQIDVILEDHKNYVRKLVMNDLGFGTQIETAIQKIKLQQDQNEENDKLDLDATTIEEEEEAEEEELTDEEIMAFYADKEQQRQKDNFEQNEVYG